MKKYIKIAVVLFMLGFVISAFNINNRRDIHLDTFKSKGVVTIVVTGMNIDSMTEITILRGTEASESLRQIKILSENDLKILKSAPLTLVDKFPLSGTDHVLYRACVTYKAGYQKYFPASEMKIDTSYTK